MDKQSYKEKLLRREVKKLEKEIKNIDFLISASPFTEIVNIRKEAQKLLDKNEGWENRTKPEFMSKIVEFAEKEKYWFGIREKQKNTLQLMDKKLELVNALSEMKMDLYHIDRKNNAQKKC